MQDPKAGSAVTIVAHDVGGVGGMEQQITTLIDGLLDRGHTVTVVARACRLPAREGLRFVRVPAPRRPFALYYPWFMLAGSVAVMRNRSDVVHTTGVVVLARSDLSTVHFCHHAYQALENRAEGHGGAGRLLNARIARVMSRVGETLYYRRARCRRLVPVSNGVANELRRFLPRTNGMITVIPNGVDRERFKPDAERGAATRAELGLGADEVVALFVGGDWERKGLGVAIDALPFAPGWRLVVVGEGDRPGHVERARRLGVEDRVIFAGRHPDTERFYAAADAFVFPTTYEAFPLVALEAAAAGVPLIATRVNGVEELVRDGESGRIVARSGEEFGRALAELGADPALRDRMGQAARDASAQYAWETVVERYSALYEELAGAQEPAA
jgi:glycosyltransferase involved in cell wall biosynthesis